MSKLVVGYVLSDKYLSAQFVATGEMPAAVGKVEFDSVAMTPEQRATVVAYAGTGLEFDIRVNPEASNLMELDGTPTLAEAIEHARRLLAMRQKNTVERLSRKIADGVARFRRQIAAHDPEINISSYYLQRPDADDADALGLDTSEWRALLAEIETHADEWRAEKRAEKERLELVAAQIRAAEERRSEEAKAAFLATKSAWVAEHGSDWLRRACADGYDCARLYVTERAAMEAPGFEVDFQDRAGWKSRSCPSVAALDLADKMKSKRIGSVEVVWLTRPVEDQEWFEECEAVVVRDYLGKYDLVQTV